jgi:hypothetical protein
LIEINSYCLPLKGSVSRHIMTMTSVRIIAILLISIPFGLLGCSLTPSLAMRIETPAKDTKILLGRFVGSIALIHGSPKNAEIQASDGVLDCTGRSNTGQFSTDMRINRISHNFPITCSNGTTGQLILNINASPASISGIGVGTLSDGSKIRVVVGDLSGTLAW